MLGSLPVDDRPRRFDPPEMARPADTAFGDAIRLVGYDPEVLLDPPTLDLTLYWRALRDGPGDLSIFVHLLDGDRIVAQRDTRPNGGATPTTGWLAGEYLLDGYEMISLPEGLREFSIVVGVTEAETGARLPASTGGTSVRLGPFSVPR